MPEINDPRKPIIGRSFPVSVEAAYTANCTTECRDSADRVRYVLFTIKIFVEVPNDFLHQISRHVTATILFSPSGFAQVSLQRAARLLNFHAIRFRRLESVRLPPWTAILRTSLS